MDKSSSKKKIVKSKKAAKPTLVRLTHKIDATDQILGRLAVKIALLLRGKNKPSFTFHQDLGDNVIVANVSKLKFTAKKLEQKNYYHYSGYPGGLKTTQLKRVMEQKPEKVLQMAVWNMLPKNKLRAKMIKRLKISK
ncbi:MAG: 50S ribosomal protein L13 [Patescibacteria group bacterium]